MYNIFNTYLTSFVILALSILLSSCSSNFTTRTNLDAKNFSDYFSPSKVSIITSINDLEGEYKYLGLVEGEDCQKKQHHAKPDEINARTQARKKAYKLNANAIIFTGCAQLNKEATSKQCVSATVCYAQAYLLETQPK